MSCFCRCPVRPLVRHIFRREDGADSEHAVESGRLAPGRAWIYTCQDCLVREGVEAAHLVRREGQRGFPRGRFTEG